MAGPIRTFIDTLQERQPVRNALRGVLGLPQRRATVIDPFEEMAARDREMGGDISNPYPDTRMAPRIASTATTGPAVAAGLPAPQMAQAAPEMIATPAPADPTQPLAGMGMMQGIFTAPSEVRQRRGGGVPVRQVSQQGGDLSASARAISESPMSEEEKGFAQARLMYSYATQPGIDPDRAKTLMRAGENFHRGAMQLYAVRMGSESVSAASTAAEKAAESYRLATDSQGQNALAQLTEEGNQNRLTNAALEQSRQNAMSRSATAADELEPLDKNPTLSITSHANTARTAVMANALQNKMPRDLAGEQMEFDRVFEMGFGHRLAQYSKESSGRAFGPNHPGYPEVANYYRQKIAAKPKDYDQILAQVRGIVAASAGSQLSQYKPDYAVQRYVDGLAADIVGPRPKQFSVYDYLPGGK